MAAETPPDEPNNTRAVILDFKKEQRRKSYVVAGSVAVLLAACVVTVLLARHEDAGVPAADVMTSHLPPEEAPGKAAPPAPNPAAAVATPSAPATAAPAAPVDDKATPTPATAAAPSPTTTPTPVAAPAAAGVPMRLILTHAAPAFLDGAPIGNKKQFDLEVGPGIHTFKVNFEQRSMQQKVRASEGKGLTISFSPKMKKPMVRFLEAE